ncbi:hypothetical protein P167DRAFT_535719 [Morchella conica CCBAS932]|uniref:Uncharacterized protein n=1 Tax=Morchella conica CCBAS932 TaxID=1392247 RepID=A0A3N4KT93_9PEZI|nr:hypothetical protein P167DRAFT_535719 [Morchella conica CCBAS932]
MDRWRGVKLASGPEINVWFPGCEIRSSLESLASIHPGAWHSIPTPTNIQRPVFPPSPRPGWRASEPCKGYMASYQAR